MGVLNISDSNEFENTVLSSGKPAVVDFWAAWCGPCKMIAPEIEAVAEDFENKAVVAKVNVDDQRELANKYSVVSIPTLVFFKDGSEVSRISGFREKEEIVDALEKFM